MAVAPPSVHVRHLGLTVDDVILAKTFALGAVLVVQASPDTANYHARRKRGHEAGFERGVVDALSILPW